MYVKSCAPPNKAVCWEDIDFNIAKAFVKKLQRRIYAAYSQGNVGKVNTLIHLMLHSFYAKACAVRHVCSTHGKKTAGVDGVLWLTNSEKFNAISELRLRGYKPSPLKRAYIKKNNGHVRMLGIPTMKDRAFQTLYRFALEPIAEVLSDKHSYGFRQGRNVKDAILQLEKYVSKNPKCEWILKADIESCFDNISHEWLLKNVQVYTALLRKFLKAGFIKQNVWYPTDKGVPQGGSVSSILCNLTLDGLERRCTDIIPCGVIRYADDFIIISDDRQILVQEVIPAVENFLNERGLKLSKNKTSIVNIRESITFLGWEIFKKNGKVQILPSHKALHSFWQKILAICIEPNWSEKDKIKRMKHVIKGWMNFYSIASYPFFLDIEYLLVQGINQLTRKRYPVGEIFEDLEKKRGEIY